MYQTLNCRGHLLHLDKPQIMGILNVTPDSYVESSRAQNERSLMARMEKLLNEGATIIDIGACSTRPGGPLVDEDEELRRLEWALPLIRREYGSVILSVDTFRSRVARISVESFCADMVNDVSGGHADPEMFAFIAKMGIPYVLTYSPMSPKDVHESSIEGDVVKEMMLFFAEKISQLHALGAKDIVLDPGFGFGKTLRQNYGIMQRMDRLEEFELPILVGISRKRMLKDLLHIDTEQSLNATTALHVMALERGSRILRVHDVKAAMEAIEVWKAVRNPNVLGN